MRQNLFCPNKLQECLCRETKGGKLEPHWQVLNQILKRSAPIQTGVTLGVFSRLCYTGDRTRGSQCSLLALCASIPGGYIRKQVPGVEFPSSVRGCLTHLPFDWHCRLQCPSPGLTPSFNLWLLMISAILRQCLSPLARRVKSVSGFLSPWIGYTDHPSPFAL